jgi:hypothetical protein
MTSTSAAIKSNDCQPDRFLPVPPRQELRGGPPTHPDNKSNNNDLESGPACPPLSSEVPAPVTVPGTLGLVPLRPPSNKTKRLEVKQLPVVLGRTNLAQWWYQSCDCQHYYCRFHCRPVAQNIGSLSKVMIQIDSTGMVHLVGKNPHLVTITPEREDQILQLNDILSIGRRDREPWMRFQVVSKTDAPTINAVGLGTKGEPAPKRLKNTTGSADDGGRDLGAFGSIGASQNKIHAGGGEDSNSNNQGSNNTPRDAPVPSDQINVEVLSRGQHQQSLEYQQQPPEWITTTTTGNRISSRNISSKNYDDSSISAKLYKHQAIVSRLAKAAQAAASAATNLQGLDATKQKRDYLIATGGVQGSNESGPITGQRKRCRGRGIMTESNNHPIASGTNHYSGVGGNGGGHFSSKAIRSADDLFIGSLHRRDSHHPQIHLVFQDYEISARLVRATRRGHSSPSDADMNQRERTLEKQHTRQPRTNQNFLSKPSLHRPQICPQVSSRDCDGIGGLVEDIHKPTQLGMLSKNFEAALFKIDGAGNGSMNEFGKKNENETNCRHNKEDDIFLPPNSSTAMIDYMDQGEAERDDDTIKIKDEFRLTTDRTTSIGQSLSTGTNHYSSDGSPQDPSWNNAFKKTDESGSIVGTTDGVSLPPLLDDESPAEPKHDCM